MMMESMIHVVSDGLKTIKMIIHNSTPLAFQIMISDDGDKDIDYPW